MGREREDPSQEKVPYSTCFSFLSLLEILGFLFSRLDSAWVTDLDGPGGRQRQQAGGLSAHRRVLMMFLFWSLLVPPPPSLSHPIPELVGGDREREEERSGTSLQAGKKQWPSSSKIVYLGSPRRSRILIFEVEKKIFFLIKALK